MSWIALLLVGVAVADLAHSVRRVPIVPECTGAVAVVVLGVLCDLAQGADLAGLVVVVAVVLAWGQTVTGAFGRRRWSAWLPLALLTAAVSAGVLTSGLAGPVAGPFQEWLGDSRVPALQGIDAGRALLLGGLFLVQLSTGNVLVRLVLQATRTTNPAHRSQELKGGRLLGPMERVLIFGLGLAGQLTAAAIVIAAKGLLRWPELQSDDGQRHIHRLTEYFLVGSFVSWTVALGSLALALE